jgi:hypothetical protein
MHSFLTLVTFFSLLAGQFVYAAALPHVVRRDVTKLDKVFGRQFARAANNSSPQLVANVSATIAGWLTDIQAVNTFVDTVGRIQDPIVISQKAAVVLSSAQNEGASLAILQGEVTLDAAGQVAAQALPGQFNIIGPAIEDTITNPQNLQQNLKAINGARCPPPLGANAIAQEGAVQMSAAMAVGLTSPAPPVPFACFT